MFGNQETPIFLKVRVVQIEVAELGPFKHADSWGHSFTRRYVKGTVSQDFLLQIFSRIIFPKPLKITLGSFPNLRRYLHVKVHYRCQQHRRQILPPVPLVLKLSSGIADAGSKFAQTK
jgi:hypothetical protein